MRTSNILAAVAALSLAASPVQAGHWRRSHGSNCQWPTWATSLKYTSVGLENDSTILQSVACPVWYGDAFDRTMINLANFHGNDPNHPNSTVTAAVQLCASYVATNGGQCTSWRSSTGDASGNYTISFSASADFYNGGWSAASTIPFAMVTIPTKQSGGSLPGTLRGYYVTTP